MTDHRKATLPESVKERPILMCAPMVRACLRDVDPKTQTRRVVKWPEPHKDHDHDYDSWVVVDGVPLSRINRGDGLLSECPIACPYGRIGDHLYVKETWQPEGVAGYEQFFPIRYRSTQDERVNGHKWRPSIFMPRWASRITLEVLSVRVERLQEISHLDCIAEGLPDGTHRQRAYRELWESINGDGSWGANPFVWVVEFKRIKP